MITLHWTEAIPLHWVAIRDDGEKRLVNARLCDGWEHPDLAWDKLPAYCGNYTLTRAPAYVEQFCRLCDEVCA